MTKEVVLKYLQKHGQKIDHEIVKDTGIDLKELIKNYFRITKQEFNSDMYHYSTWRQR